MGAKLIFGFEGDVAFGFAGFIRADDVGLGEVDFQVCILFVIDVFVVVSAKMTNQVISTQVIEEHQVIEVELLTEVAIGVRKYLTMSIIANITELDVLS